MLEMLLPEYIKQLLENYQNIYAQLASQLRWLYFDEAYRLVTRVGYLDDGYIRLRLEGHWEFTGELLRELSWLYYSIAEAGRNVDMLKNALASVGIDKLRVTVVDELPRSPFTPYDSAGNELSGYIKNLDTALSAVKASIDSVNIAKVSGTTLTPRDWSQDLAKLQNIDVALSSFVGTPGAEPPGKGVVLLGYDGTYLRLVKVTPDGRLLAQLGYPPVGGPEPAGLGPEAGA